MKLGRRVEDDVSPYAEAGFRVPDRVAGELLAGLFSREAEKTGLIFQRDTLTGYVMLSLGHIGDKVTRLSVGDTHHGVREINESTTTRRAGGMMKAPRGG